MTVTRIKLHNKGFNEMRNQPLMVDALLTEADHIAMNAGEGFESQVHNKRTRAIANVYAETFEAQLAEARHGALSSAVGGG